MSKKNKVTDEMLKRDAIALAEIVRGNVLSATHCVTRVRIAVRRPITKEEDAKIKAIPMVKGSFTVGGTYQAIIGPEVMVFFRYFSDELEITKATKEEVKQIASDQKQPGKVATLVKHFSEIFVPLIPVLVAGGLLLATQNVLQIEWVSGDAASAATSVPFFNALNSFIGLPGDAVFTYLPVTVTWSVVNKLKAPSTLGITMGIMLVAPGTLANMYAIPNVMAQENMFGIQMTLTQAIEYSNGFYFGGWPFAISYQGQIIPSILAGLFGGWFYHLMVRKTSAAFKFILPPFITLIVYEIFTLGVIGPIGAALSYVVTAFFSWGFTAPIAKYFIAPIFGFFYAIIVITGIHQVFNAVMIQETISYGSNFMFPIVALSNVSQGAAVFGIVWLARKDKQLANIGKPAAITCWLGITEPAMYGVNLQFMFPFIAALIGTAVTGLLSVAFNIQAVAFGVGGIPAFLNVEFTGLTGGPVSNGNGTFTIVASGGPGWLSWVIYMLIMAFDIVFVFWLTVILSKIKKIHEYGSINFTEYMENYRKNNGEGGMSKGSVDVVALMNR